MNKQTNMYTCSAFPFLPLPLSLPLSFLSSFQLPIHFTHLECPLSVRHHTILWEKAHASKRKTFPPALSSLSLGIEPIWAQASLHVRTYKAGKTDLNFNIRAKGLRR